MKKSTKERIYKYKGKDFINFKSLVQKRNQIWKKYMYLERRVIKEKTLLSEHTIQIDNSQ